MNWDCSKAKTFFHFFVHWKLTLRFFCFVRNLNSDFAEASKFLTYFKTKITSAENESTSKKLKFSEYDINMFSLVNVEVNLNFGTYQTKNLVLIFVNMFHVACLIQVWKKIVIWVIFLAYILNHDSSSLMSLKVKH